MALTLRSVTSVERSDKVATMLDHILTPGTEAAEKQFKQSKEGLQKRSEYENYLEREAWGRVKTDRGKDLVLMFGDEDVRIFKRTPKLSTTEQAKIRSTKSGMQLTGHDLADTSGLIPVPLDPKIVRTVTGGEYVPWSKEERERQQQRKIEQALRRQQLAQQYVFVSQANNANQLTQQELFAQQMAELGIVIPQDTSRGVEPSNIPTKAWKTWMQRKQTEKEKNEADLAHQNRIKRKQRRHHRLNCKFHPFSTNSEMRRLAIQTSFPQEQLRSSVARIQHAANGAANGEGHRFVVEDCFATVDPPCGNRPETATPIEHHAGVPVGLARSKRKECAPLQLVDDETSIPSVDEQSTSAFLTETRALSALERSRVPNLSPFVSTMRPHSVEGTFIDCECTPRLTDDELGMYGTGDSSSANAGDEKKKRPKKTLLGSADAAEKQLDLWRRDFSLTTVHARSRLDSVLQEREEQRRFVTSERQHLNMVCREAEISGAGYRVSRRHRCTTPIHSSMWAPVFDTIGKDAKHVASNVEHFASVVDFAANSGMPNAPWEFDMLEEIRRRAISDASQRTHESKPQADAFSETLALSILERYGDRLLRTPSGMEFSNSFRELCKMNNRTFSAFLFSKESTWPLCHEVHNLQKALATTFK